MGEILSSAIAFIRARRSSGLALALLCLCLTPLVQAQQSNAPQQDADLAADDIIEILQQNPELLADAKAQIVSQLRDRGYPITERELTDERLFNEIRSDDRARHVMSEQLKMRGYGTNQSTEPSGQNQQRAPVAKPSPQGPQPGGAYPGNAGC